MLSYKTEVCPYCGKEREIEYIHREETDHMGYPIREWEERCDETGCDCVLGRLEFNKNKIHIKQMCCNCKFNKKRKMYE